MNVNADYPERLKRVDTVQHRSLGNQSCHYWASVDPPADFSSFLPLSTAAGDDIRRNWRAQERTVEWNPQMWRNSIYLGSNPCLLQTASYGVSSNATPYPFPPPSVVP
jgi:hypothetical protein